MLYLFISCQFNRSTSLLIGPCNEIFKPSVNETFGRVESQLAPIVERCKTHDRRSSREKAAGQSENCARSQSPRSKRKHAKCCHHFPLHLRHRCQNNAEDATPILANKSGSSQNTRPTEKGRHTLVKLKKRECHQVVNTSCQEGSTSSIPEQPGPFLSFLQANEDWDFATHHRRTAPTRAKLCKLCEI